MSGLIRFLKNRNSRQSGRICIQLVQRNLNSEAPNSMIFRRGGGRSTIRDPSHSPRLVHGDLKMLCVHLESSAEPKEASRDICFGSRHVSVVTQAVFCNRTVLKVYVCTASHKVTCSLEGGESILLENQNNSILSLRRQRGRLGGSVG